MEIFARLAPAYWWTDPAEPLDGPFAMALAIAVAIVMVAGAFAWIGARQLVPRHRLHRRLLIRAGQAGVTAGLTGLLLMLFRWQAVPFLSKRLWLILWGLTCLGALAYAFRYARTRYAEDVLAWESAERRRRYLPRPAASGGRTRRRGRRR